MSKKPMPPAKGNFLIEMNGGRGRQLQQQKAIKSIWARSTDEGDLGRFFILDKIRVMKFKKVTIIITKFGNRDKIFCYRRNMKQVLKFERRGIEGKS